MPLGFSRSVLLTASTFPVTDGLELYVNTKESASYPGSGGTLYDLSTTLNPSAPAATNMTGNANKITATGVRGGNGAFATASTDKLNDDTHTVLMYFYQTGFTSGWQKIFGYTPSGSDRSPGVWRYSNRRSWHWRYDPGNSAGSAFGPSGNDDNGTQFQDNNHYMIGVVKDGGTARSYCNRTQAKTGSVPNPKTAGNSVINWQEHGATNIYCDALAIWNRPLTEEEVFSYYDYLKNNFYPTMQDNPPES